MDLEVQGAILGESNPLNTDRTLIGSWVPARGNGILVDLSSVLRWLPGLLPERRETGQISLCNIGHGVIHLIQGEPAT